MLDQACHHKGGCLSQTCPMGQKTQKERVTDSPFMFLTKLLILKCENRKATKVLKELNTTWTSMTFEIEPHTRTKIPLLKPSDELIETLEDNQVRIARQILTCRGV